MSRHWTQDEIRWLRANVERMDLQSASRALGVPLVDVEKKVAELRAEAATATRRPPATHKEAARELSHAHRLFDKGMEHVHRREMEAAAAAFNCIVEQHIDLDRGIAAAIENFAGVNVDDRGHDGSVQRLRGTCRRTP